jgi:hypothetical protein
MVAIGKAMRCVGTAARSAQPYSSINATMRAPAGGPPPSAACRNTMPLMSWPGIHLTAFDAPGSR